MVHLLYVIITFEFKMLFSSIGVNRREKDVTKFRGSSFLSHFVERSVFSQFDDIVMITFVMCKGKFERIAFSLSR